MGLICLLVLVSQSFQTVMDMCSPMHHLFAKRYVSIFHLNLIINVLKGTPAVVFIDDCCEDVHIANLFMACSNIRVIGFADDYAFESSKHTRITLKIEIRTDH